MPHPLTGSTASRTSGLNEPNSRVRRVVPACGAFRDRQLPGQVRMTAGVAIGAVWIG